MGGLENYVYSVRNSIKDPKMEGKVDAEDKKTIESKCDEAVKWLEGHPNSEKEEYEAKKKELEGVLMPLMQKAFASGGSGGGMPNGGMGGMDPSQFGGNTSSDAKTDEGPDIEEVDIADVD